jgi:iron complex outermembrane recepter protein
LGVAAGVGRVPLNQPNLRNLPGGATGNPVTLVLLDGHRMVPSGIEQSLVDVGTMPPGILQSVETMFDGASAVYGSDAAGGVINYITRKRFNETKADARYSYANNYYAVDANVTSGKTWDGGGIGFTYSYGKNSNLLNKDRDYAISRNYTVPGNPLTGTACEDHATVTATVAGVPQVFSTPTLAPGTINCATNAYSSFVAAQDRHAGFVTLSQDLGSSVKLDVTGYYFYRKTDQNFGPPTTTITIRQGINPFFTPIPSLGAANPTTQSVAFSYGPLLGTDFLHYLTTTSLWQVNPSVTVDLGKWQLRGLFGYGRSTVTFEAPALDTTLQGLAVGNPGSPLLAFSAALNPYNILDPRQSLALVSSLFYTTHRHGQHKFTQLRVIADGPLFSMPGGEVKAAVGAESTKTDFSRVDTAGNHLRLPAVTDETSPKSLFAEINLPLVSQTNKMRGIEGLTLSLSARYDDYEVFGTTTNPKVALTYDPVKWLSLRATWGKSFRAPTVVDKVASQANGLACVSPGVLGQCIPFFFFAPPGVALPPNPVFLYETGARPDLKPETSKNWSFGFDLKPIEHLTISPTFFHIDYKNLISLPTQGSNGGLAQIFAGAPQLVTMFPTAAQIAAAVAAVPNGGATNLAAFLTSCACTVAYILDGRTTNLGGARVSGTDLSVRYDRPTSFGSIDANLNGTWQLVNETAFFPDSAFTDGIGANASRVKLTASVAANMMGGAFRAQALVEHQNGFDLSPSATRLASQTKIGGFDLLNLSFRYDVKGTAALAQDLTLTLTINNVLDKDPPVNLTTTGGPGNGQTIGRLVQFGVAKKF